MTNIDWIAYFKEFSSVHGGDPVLMGQNKRTSTGGWFLFSDGWRYGRSPEGPEYPPETENKQLKLIRIYWKIRLRVKMEGKRQLNDLIRNLATTQQQRSATIMTSRVVSQEDETGVLRRRVETAPIDFEMLIDEYRLITHDIKNCRERLDNITLPPPRMLPTNVAAILTSLEEIDKEV